MLSPKGVVRAGLPLFQAMIFALLASPAALAQTEEAATPARIPAVTVATAEPRDLMLKVALAGTLVPREEVLVYPDQSGYAIKVLMADIGDRVQAGDVLAQLDDRALKQKVSQADAEEARAAAGVLQALSQVSSADTAVKQARQTLDRTTALLDSGSGTQAAFDQAEAAELTAEAALQNASNGVAIAKAALQQAQVSLEIAKEDLQSAQIKSPADGIISARSGQVGGIAAASGEPIFRIIRDGVVEVEAEVIETELALLAPGQTAELDVAGLAPVAGEVRLVAPVVDAANRLGSVRISTTAQDGLRPGVFVGGWITVAERKGLAVPVTAVISDADGAHVLLVVNDVLEQRPVKTGLMWQDWMEVTEGLAAGDQVVARAGAFFAAGDSIRSVPAEAAP